MDKLLLRKKDKSPSLSNDNNSPRKNNKRKLDDTSSNSYLVSYKNSHRPSKIFKINDNKNYLCKICRKLGHKEEDCYSFCRRCFKVGHSEKLCVTPMNLKCVNCGSFGHTMKNCLQHFCSVCKSYHTKYKKCIDLNRKSKTTRYYEYDKFDNTKEDGCIL